jgi:lysine/ornithine N-monooxygenase
MGKRIIKKRQRMRYYTIHNDILAKVFDLMNDQSLLLNLTVVKFMKSVVCNNVSEYIK